MVEPVSIDSVLIVYGPLGIMTMISLFAALKLWKDGKEKDAVHRAAIEAKDKACADERKAMQDTIRALEDRIIAKAETWMERYGQLSTSLGTVIDSALKLRATRNTGGQP